MALLAALREIETALGRRRDGPRWSPRSIDLDLLLFGSQIIGSADLTVPHPRMAFRRFVIEPAAEVAPTMIHPTIGWTLAELRDHLRDAPSYVAIAGARARANRNWRPKCPARSAHVSHGSRGAANHAIEPHQRVWPDMGVGDRITQLAIGRIDRSKLGEEELRETVVSDYWFDQAMCFAPLTLASSRLDEFNQLWHSAAATVLQPKLLVLLDAPVESIWNRVKTLPQWLNRGSFVQLRQSIEQHAYQ